MSLFRWLACLKTLNLAASEKSWKTSIVKVDDNIYHSWWYRYMLCLVTVVYVHILYCDCGMQEEEFAKHWTRTWTMSLMNNPQVLL